MAASGPMTVEGGLVKKIGYSGSFVATPNCVRLGGVSTVVQAEAEDVAARARDRRQQRDTTRAGRRSAALEHLAGTGQRGRAGLDEARPSPRAALRRRRRPDRQPDRRRPRQAWRCRRRLETSRGACSVSSRSRAGPASAHGRSLPADLPIDARPASRPPSSIGMIERTRATTSGMHGEQPLDALVARWRGRSSGGRCRAPGRRSRPSAVSTCETSSVPEVQAEPLDAQMSCWSRSIRIDSPSVSSKTKLALFGEAVRRMAGQAGAGTEARMPSISRSRRAASCSLRLGRSSSA